MSRRVTRFVPRPHPLALAIALLGLLGGVASADPIYRDDTDPGDTDWLNANNWYNASLPSDVWMPTLSDDVYVGDTSRLATATVDIAAGEGGALASTLTLGNDAGSSGTLRLHPGGSLNVSDGFTVGGGGLGAFVQTGGTLGSPYTLVRGTFDQTGGDAGALYHIVTDHLGGEARQSLGPGSLTTNVTLVGMAMLPEEGPPFLPAAGRFDQAGGTHTVLAIDAMGGLGVGALPGGTGVYTLSGAEAMLAAPVTGVGVEGGNGTFLHTAGTHFITSDGWFGDPEETSALPPGLIIGSGLEDGSGGGTITDPGTGIYQLTGGSLTITRTPPVGFEEVPFGAAIWLGVGGTGTLLLGDANGTASLSETDPPTPSGDELGVSLILRPMPLTPGDAATFRGWGNVGLTGMLFNNGRVIADGYGQDRTLDLSSFALVTSAAGLEGFPLLQGDGTQAGWYAQNHGRLLLPTHTEGNAVLWGTAPVEGEEQGVPVNSLAILFGNMQDAPPLSIALLAADHGDVPAGTTGSILGIWDIQLGAPLPDGAFADLVFRYDDLLADQFVALLGLDELDIQVYHFDGLNWQPLSTGVDTDEHLAFVGGITSFSPFAVGWNVTSQPAAIPEPASVVLLLGGLAALARRRKR